MTIDCIKRDDALYALALLQTIKWNGIEWNGIDLNMLCQSVCVYVRACVCITQTFPSQNAVYLNVNTTYAEN